MQSPVGLNYGSVIQQISCPRPIRLESNEQQSGESKIELYAGLQKAGHEVVLLETRHVKAALSAMTPDCAAPRALGVQAASTERAQC